MASIGYTYASDDDIWTEYGENTLTWEDAVDQALENALTRHGKGTTLTVNSYRPYGEDDEQPGTFRVVVQDDEGTRETWNVFD